MRLSGSMHEALGSIPRTNTNTLESVCVCVCARECISFIPGWSYTHYIAEYDFEQLIIFPLLPTC